MDQPTDQKTQYNVFKSMELRANEEELASLKYKKELEEKGNVKDHSVF